MKQKHADYKMAPYPKFRRLEAVKELIESGYGLDDSTVEAEQAVASGTSHKS